VKGRQISENVRLVQQYIHSIRSTGEPCMLTKLKMENAFHQVQHSFMFEVLRTFRFYDNFVEWIKACM
jgi:hypothetical protein